MPSGGLSITRSLATKIAIVLLVSPGANDRMPVGNVVAVCKSLPMKSPGTAWLELTR